MPTTEDHPKCPFCKTKLLWDWCYDTYYFPLHMKWTEDTDVTLPDGTVIVQHNCICGQTLMFHSDENIYQHVELEGFDWELFAKPTN